MITLPLTNQRWPSMRLLTRANWGGTIASGDGWTVRAMERRSPRAVGFILLNYTRALLPQIGTAEIVCRFGVYSGRIRWASGTSVIRQGQGEQWDPNSDTMDIPDLTGQEIRIQAAYPDADGVVSDSAWVTVWWGTCEYQIDDGWGASRIPSGERTYHCVDAFHRTKRWSMDRHGFISSAGTIAPAAGHPGYNVSQRSPSQIAGNKDSTASTWSAQDDGVSGRKFVMPGGGDPWTDAEAVNEALTNHRQAGQPHWILGGAADLFNTSSPWPVEEGDTVFDVVARICARSRGRGAVLPTWTESSPLGALTATLTAFSQVHDDITYSDPAASQVIVTGAATRDTAVDVDLIGDHRFLPSSLRLGDPEQYRVDYLVSQGERIEVLGTVEYSSTLEIGWDSGEQTDFLDLDPVNRIDERWKPVYQLHRLKRGFQMSLGDGNGGSQASADYRCTDAGVVTTTTQPNAIGDSAPDMIEVMDDLPLYDGYNYAGGPARWDSQTVTAFSGTPPRRQPMLLIRTDSDLFRRHSSLSFSVQMRVLPDGFLITCGDDQDEGTRRIGNPSDSDLQSAYNYDRIVITLGFRLPHRVRLATGKPKGARRLTLTYPNIHLWQAASNAIWDLDGPNEDGKSYPPKRTAGGAPGLLRDDRSALARLHALACAWYRPPVGGTPAGQRSSAIWSLRCCGDIPTSTDYDGGGVVYPSLGKVVHHLSANGTRHELNTVVSTTTYDHTIGITTWTTDWQDLDLRNG